MPADLLSSLRAEREKHAEVFGQHAEVFGHCNRCFRHTDGLHLEPWPCPTARALDVAIALAKGVEHIPLATEIAHAKGCSGCRTLERALAAWEGKDG